MLPPVFKTVDADPNVRALLRSSNSSLSADPVTRMFEFGEAPQNTPVPYAVWQVVSGSPDNYITNRPDVDSYTIQIDVYAADGNSAEAVAVALRDAFEGVSHVTSWRSHGRDSDTADYRIGFDVRWIVQRPPYRLTPGYDQFAPGFGVYRVQFDQAMNDRWAAA